MDFLFLISLMHGVVVTMLLHRYYRIFFTDCRVSVPVEWLCYGLTLAVCTVASILSHNAMLVNLAAGLLTKYFLTYIYRTSHRLRITVPLIFMVAVLVFEVGLMFLMTPAQASLIHQPKSIVFHSVGPLFTVIALYVFVFIVEGVRSTKTGIHFTLKYWVCFALTPIITFLTIVTVMSIPGVTGLYVGMCSFLLLGINLLSFYFYEIMVSYISNKMEKEIAEEKNLYYAKQLETLTAMTDSLRSYQHDLKNHAIIADAMFYAGEYEKVREYYYDVMRRPLLQNRECISGNSTVDSLLNYKIIEAKNKGVSLDLSVAIPPIFRIRTSSMVVVFGNLLDNAIEAAAAAEDKTVTVNFTYSHHCIMLQIRNRYNGEHKRRGSRYLSTKENADLHGYGLRNVERIVEENGGVLSITDENNVFTVKVLLYDKE